MDEFAELDEVRFMSTLRGLCFILINVELAFAGFGGLSELWGDRVSSNLGRSPNDRRGVGVALLRSSTDCQFLSVSFLDIRFGDGDLDEFIHDFRANVANDSDTVLVLLSRRDFEIECTEGTGGAPAGVVFLVLCDSEELCLSGEVPLTLCIHDFGRATKLFLLPTRSGFGSSSFCSFARRLLALGSFFFSVLFSAADVVGRTSADTILPTSFSDGPWGSRVGRQLKLADRGRDSSCRVAGRLKSNWASSGILGDECERGRAGSECTAGDMVIVDILERQQRSRLENECGPT